MWSHVLYRFMFSTSYIWMVTRTVTNSVSNLEPVTFNNKLPKSLLSPEVVHNVDERIVGPCDETGETHGEDCRILQQQHLPAWLSLLPGAATVHIHIARYCNVKIILDLSLQRKVIFILFIQESPVNMTPLAIGKSVILFDDFHDRQFPAGQNQTFFITKNCHVNWLSYLSGVPVILSETYCRIKRIAPTQYNCKMNACHPRKGRSQWAAVRGGRAWRNWARRRARWRCRGGGSRPPYRLKCKWIIWLD